MTIEIINHEGSPGVSRDRKEKEKERERERERERARKREKKRYRKAKGMPGRKKRVQTAEGAICGSRSALTNVFIPWQRVSVYGNPR